jgi:large subunit ribosomal protein L35
VPKMKTHRGAAKRFKVTGSGKFMKSHAFKSHLLVSKSPKRKRRLRRSVLASENDAKRIRRMMPYA